MRWYILIMVAVTHDDVSRLFPSMQDHTVVEGLAMGTTVDELEAAFLLLQGNDEELEETNCKGSRLNLLLELLADPETPFRDELEI